MSVKINHYDNVTVLSIKGDLTGDITEVFVDRATKCLDEGRLNLLIDCSEVAAMDSAALEGIIDLQKRCEDELGFLKLSGLDETCRRILEVTRLARRFETFEDIDSAVKSF